MTKWQEVRLGDVCKLQNGKKRPKEPGKYPVFGGNGILDYTNQFNSNVGVIVGRVGAYCGSVFLSKEKCWVSDNAILGINTSDTDIIYLYYLLKSLNLNAKHIGSGQPLITQDILNNIKIFLPPLDVQKKIAGVLGALDDKIELNNKINNNLEQQAQALFKSWFVDREYEVEKDTTLGVVCKCELGGTPSRVKPEYWNGNIAWINSGEVNNFRIIKASEYITEIGLKHSATKLLPRKTTVIAITGATLGQISLLEIDSCTNQSVVGILENETLPYEFIYPYICHNIKELLSHQTGGAQQHINKQNVEQIALSLPKATLIKDYKNIVAPIFELIAKNCFESERLAALRDTLLPKLMSGEIDVSKVDISAFTSADKLSFSED